MIDQTPRALSVEDAENAFLDFVAREIDRNPGLVVPITEEMMARSMELVAGVEVDPDEELPGDITF